MEEGKPIPSPYTGPEILEVPLDLHKVQAFIDEFKRFFNVRELFIVVKTNHRHAHCGEKSCDGYTKLVINQQLSKQELQDLSENLNKMFGI